MARKEQKKCRSNWFILGVIWCLTPLSAIFQLTQVHHSYWWKKPEYPERTSDHGQATGKFYQFAMRIECTFLCNFQSRVRTHIVLVIGWYKLLGKLLGKVYSMQHDTILFSATCDWTMMFSTSTSDSPNNKADRNARTEILLEEKVEDINGVIRHRKLKQDRQCKKCRYRP